MSSTRQRILDHALSRFNDAGVEAVGIREIARELGLSPGNVSYHFPRKDDLVAALAAELGVRNEGALDLPERTVRAEDFLEAFRRVYRNQVEFRFLALSVVHLVEHIDAFRGGYGDVVRARRAMVRQWLIALREHGEIGNGVSEEDLERLVAHCTFISRFWLSEKRVTFPEAAFDDAIEHYLGLIADLLARWATPKGAPALRLQAGRCFSR